MQVNRDLRIIANRQWGYFTGPQAEKAGYPNNLQRYHAGCGNWRKVDRSLYRLPGYDDTLESDFVRWTLWAAGQSRSRQVVVSHDSALHYYGLTPMRPAAVHLSVSSLRHRPEADGCVLHWEQLNRQDFEEREGFRLATPLHTLRVMRPDLVLASQWTGAVTQAQQLHLLNDLQAAELLRGGEAIAAPQSGGGEVAPVATTGLSLTETAGRDTVAYEEAQAGEGTFTGNTEWRRANMQRVAGEFTRARSSFTLIEMLVVVAIICVLAGMLMPALHNAIDMSRRASCANNLKQIGQVFTVYAGDFNGDMPAYETGVAGANGNLWQVFWYANARLSVVAAAGTVNPAYLAADDDLLRCPTLPRYNKWYNACFSYALLASSTIHSATVGDNAWRDWYGQISVKNLRGASGMPTGKSQAAPASASRRVIATDLQYAPPYGPTNYLGNPGYAYCHNFTGANSVLADGHVEWFENPIVRIPASNDDYLQMRGVFYTANWSQCPYVGVYDGTYAH